MFNQKLFYKKLKLIENNKILIMNLTVCLVYLYIEIKRVRNGRLKMIEINI